MKVLEEIKVSVYENVYSKQPKVMSFLEIIFMCIHPVYATIINTIRRYHTEGDQAAAQKLKSQLPCFTPAGTFNGAHAIKNFLHHSNIVGLDYDHVLNRQEVIQRCAADPHTVAALESPTDGVKIFAYVEGIEDRHREGQLLVSQYYNRLLGLESDPACKDESRLCYFTYSPNGYVASLYQSFVMEPSTCREESSPSFENEIPLPFPDSKNTPENLPEEKSEVSEEEIKQFFSSYIFLYPLTAGQRHSNLFKLACEACRRHYPQKNILRELTSYFEHTDFPSAEISSVLSSGYKKVAEQSADNSAGVASSYQKDKKPKGHYDAPEYSDEMDENYWTGEELRKSTPTFPHNVYDNLPEILNACLLEEGSDREQDISFLSVLTALSAALPQTFGIYNHKRYSTHLYSVVFSPAGSGKGIAQTGRYLLEEIQERILSTSEFLQKKYDTQHSNWQRECSQRKKSGETCSEEPQRPPFKMLFIPATTSYTRMQIQMQDNGPQGSIIFDTEAQTLTTANHLDCGNFDDMLRKAFEHENIDSSYKANGIRPIYIRHPKLALFLTGTLGQVDILLSNYEGGLPSRILTYTFRETPHWKDMGDDSISLEDSFKPIAHHVSELYAFCLEHPVVFHLSRPQWNHLNEIFSRMLSEVATEGNDDLQAVVKRYAFLVMRISMIQTRIRQFESCDPSLDIYCTDEDFERSLRIVLCCYEHSRLLLSSMPSPSIRPLKNPDTIRNFVNELPENFSTDEAIRLGEKYDFSHRKVTRLLKSLNGVKINKLSHGVYSKMN
ncbi:DUF3987 domain-containing protein [uncultured Bacteroides sp.]|uniref:DUF3987 domain-containing protein n=1 Tax=uncultured Bacteroides sp. TaxID=162156 RepID=UPI0025EDA8A6|nr:DUF3987 domain-containing protein [uncultured Bacteroides sp.]